MRESKTLSQWYEDWSLSQPGFTWYGSDCYYFNAKPFSKARMVHFYASSEEGGEGEVVYERLDLVPDDEVNEELEPWEEKYYYLEE